MAMTIAEKIIAAHVGQDAVRPGEFYFVPVDCVMANDVTAPMAIGPFERTGATEVFDPERVVLIPDHYVPNKDIKAAEQAKVMREFAHKHKLPYYYEVGRACVCHSLLPDEGHVLPGDVIIGADSHTCTHGALGAFATGMGSTDIGVAMALGQTWLRVPESIKFVFTGSPRSRWVGAKDYILAAIGRIGVAGALYCAMEFTGEAVAALSMPGRFTMCNMAIEAGGKAGIIAADAKTAAFLEGRTRREGVVYQSDPDAVYREVVEIDVTDLEPQVACPHLPSNVKPVADVADVRIDQAFVGSCTNGRHEDLTLAASVIRGRTVHPAVRLIVIPSSREDYVRCLKEGLDEVFVEAGAIFSTPTCGPCLGGHMGVLAAGETAISTSNRNFRGRMGSGESQVYLSNPAVAAASAVLGRIGSPDEL